jgi:hypothetical protein
MIAGVVPDIEQIANQTPGASLAVKRFMHLAPCRSSINAADDEVYRAVIAAALKKADFSQEEFLVRVPAESMEKVDAVDEDSGLVPPNIR